MVVLAPIGMLHLIHDYFINNLNDHQRLVYD